MYRPSAFAVKSRDALEALIREVSFGICVLTGTEGPVLVGLPLHLERRDDAPGVLCGHLARANPASRLLQSGARAVVSFLGAQGSVSPRWYCSQGPAVPTWNYLAVEVEGVVRPCAPGSETRALLDTLTRVHEERVGSDWGLDEIADGPLTERLLSSIVAFEITIERMEGKWKLGQNRPVAERRAVVEALEALGEPGGHALAAHMRTQIASELGVVPEATGQDRLTVAMADTTLEVAGCFDIMRQLRTQLSSAEEFAACVERQARSGGYQLLRVLRSGRVVGCAGFRRLETLYGGRMLYVDDLVTLEDARSRGVGRAMLDALLDLAKKEGRASIHLDSGVQRFAAHRFYLRRGYEIRSHHFVLPV